MSSRSYPPGAIRTVPVKATDDQKMAWEFEAARHGKASAGAFLAWTGDLYIALLYAYRDAVEKHDDSLDGPGGAALRREERERRRREEEGES